MYVGNCSFEGTDIGLRLKAERGQGGVVENIVYENITMKDVASPILITSYYHGLPKVGEKHEVKEVDARTPIWRNIRMTNITATGGVNAGLVMGLPEMPIDGLVLENISIAGVSPLRIGYIRGLVLKNVKFDIQDGSPVIIDDQVVGEGLEALKK
jgi:polygalacturonase